MKTLKKKRKLRSWVKVVIFYAIIAILTYFITCIIKAPTDQPKGSIKILEIIK